MNFYEKLKNWLFPPFEEIQIEPQDVKISDEVEFLLEKIVGIFEEDSSKIIDSLFEENGFEEEKQICLNRIYSKKLKLEKDLKQMMDSKLEQNLILKKTLEDIYKYWEKFLANLLRDAVISHESLNSEILTYGERLQIEQVLKDKKQSHGDKAKIVLGVIKENIARVKSLDFVSQVRSWKVKKTT